MIIREMFNSTSKYEVLAPAGSYKCMVAAFNAGADAVYMGGNMFGARANADNFSDEEIIQAIEYAHIRGKKIFLTVNTLLKDEELKQSLNDYIKPLYEAGLDAVIVQDFGVLDYVKKHFPDMDIHASTQMTVTGKEFAKKLKSEGVSRVVPARELSTAEIRDIYDATGLEIECFVHGALCYCYSGMCLLSSIIGGRSGNRGRCAQPCRLPYDVQLKDSYISGEYPLSPADLCALEILPDILEAGVYSLKIEGRMKKPEYVASVVAMYRKYVDMFETKGRTGYKVDPEDIRLLKDIYNRGEFTDGYYKRHNGPEVMSVKRPNHSGTKAALIVEFNKQSGSIKAKALEDIHADDVLEIFADAGLEKDTEIKSVNAKQGDICSFKLPMKINANLQGKYIMRTRNNALISYLDSEYISNEKREKVKIGGSVVVCKDMPVSIDVWAGDEYAHIEGDTPMEALNRPVSVEDISKQIMKTGGTDFVFDENMLNITLDEGLFINIKELNRLRREVIEQLRLQICSKYRRTNLLQREDVCEEAYEDAIVEETINTALVSTREQFEVVVSHNKIATIYVESYLAKNVSNWNELIATAHNNNKEIFMALPYIFRTHAKHFFEARQEFLKDNELDGYVFRNMEEICWFETNNIDFKKAIFDNTLYGLNNAALDKLGKYNPYMLTASFELNAKELGGISKSNMELCVYGAMPVMVSAGCIKKTYNKCDKQRSNTPIKDRLGNYFTAVNSCDFCYNVVYNSRPTVLYDIANQCHCKFMAYRYAFVTESRQEVIEVLEGKYKGDFTRGHFKRGVE